MQELLKPNIFNYFYFSPFIGKSPVIVIAVHYQVSLNTSAVSEVAQEQSQKLSDLYCASANIKPYFA